MKNISILFVLLTLSLFSLGDLSAQEFNVPPLVNIVENLHTATLGIRIWGWSRSGNVALSVERSESEWTGPHVNFYVMNLITDEVLHTWSSMIDWEELEQNGIESVYETNRANIISAMNNYGIIQHHTEFSQFPLVVGNYIYTAHTRIVARHDDWPWIEFDIIVARNKRDKIIRTARNGDSEDGIFGYFKSPFENRILVVSGTLLSSHGGMSYNLSGCHLNVGF